VERRLWAHLVWWAGSSTPVALCGWGVGSGRSVGGVGVGTLLGPEGPRAGSCLSSSCGGWVRGGGGCSVADRWVPTCVGGAWWGRP